MTYDLLDGQFVKHGDKIFTGSIAMNMLFSQTLRAIRNRLMFWNEHVGQMTTRLALLRQPIPWFLDDNGRELRRQAERSLVKNKLFKSARVDIVFFKNNNAVGYMILMEAITATCYEFNGEGLTLELCEEITKAATPFSNSAAGSEPYWQILSASRESTANEPALSNEQGALVETPGKSIYIVTGNSIHTPALQTGAFISPARDITRIVCEARKFTFYEDAALTPKDLYAADEVFLSGDMYGIQWVKAFREKRYHNRSTRLLNEDLNKILGF